MKKKKLLKKLEKAKTLLEIEQQDNYDLKAKLELTKRVGSYIFYERLSKTNRNSKKTMDGIADITRNFYKDFKENMCDFQIEEAFGMDHK